MTFQEIANRLHDWVHPGTKNGSQDTSSTRDVQSNEPLANQEKYCVVGGDMVLRPNELVKSSKVKRQLEWLSKKLDSDQSK